MPTHTTPHTSIPATIHTHHRTWLEIDLKTIARNTRSLKSLLSQEVSLMAVVKSNAYGHGMVLSAYAALSGGAEWLAVDEFYEALELRAKGVKVPILVLGFTLPVFYKEAIEKNISLTISSLDSLRFLAETFKISRGASKQKGRRLKIHIKFDTGLHRQGLQKKDVDRALALILDKKFESSIMIEGTYTHFAAMEDPSFEKYSRAQAKSFKEIIVRLQAKGFTPITHAGASSAILFSKDFNFDMSRTGISLYGLWPSPEIKMYMKKKNPKFSLAPALSWKTIIGEIKSVPKGSRIGYNLTCKVSKDSRIAIIPVGYWHGLPISLSNKGDVLVNGKRARIIGRISMDMAIIDITHIKNVKQGDEVVILGKQGKEILSVEELAEKAGTINYEFITRINPLLPRIYKENP